MPKPAIIEAFNVEISTALVLDTGGTGRGTRMGELLADRAKALGWTITQWEPIKDGQIWRLRIHISYP
jgi:hypothetical protein